MAIGDRVRIITEKEYRIMSPPRRPRGEKPRTTILHLRRQLANTQILASQKNDTIKKLEKQIASQDVELSECADREQILTTELENSADSYGRILAVHQQNASRLAYLEGYFYAKSTEAIRGPSEGDSRSHPYGAAAGKESEPEDIAGRHGGPPRGQVWRFRPDDPAFNYRGPLDGPPVAGGAHDASTSELERHRR